jgi:hypothetical protein
MAPLKATASKPPNPEPLHEGNGGMNCCFWCWWEPPDKVAPRPLKSFTLDIGYSCSPEHWAITMCPIADRIAST